MDDATAWLQANDPDYAASSLAFKHIAETGEYRGPREETPWGDTTDIDTAVSEGGKLVDHIPTVGQRLCWVCERPFEPRKSDHRTCSETCRTQARRAYQRELMRQRREAA